MALMGTLQKEEEMRKYWPHYSVHWGAQNPGFKPMRETNDC